MRNILAIPDLPFNIKPFIDITDTLPSRSPDPEQPRTPDQITHISVHHSAVEGGSIQGYANDHVNTRGWAHIGYHLVVKGDQTFQTNDLLTFSYHTASNNYYTVSVSVSANLEKRSMSEDERCNLYAAILTCMYLFNIPVENVMGHREFPIPEPTQCPCMDMNKVRDDIRALKTKIDYVKSEAGIQQLAYHVATQIEFLANLARGFNPDGSPATQGNKIWGTNSLLELKPFMEERNLL